MAGVARDLEGVRAAVIEQFPARLVLSRPNPALLVNARAALPCGCAIYVGIRVDNHEYATLGRACSEEHERVVNAANVALFDSLILNPTDRPLLDVVDEFLAEAAA